MPYVYYLEFPLLMNDVVTASRKLQNVDYFGVYLRYEKLETQNKYFSCGLNNWKGEVCPHGGKIYYYDPDENGWVEVCLNDGINSIGPENMIRTDDRRLIRIRPFMEFRIEGATFSKEERKSRTEPTTISYSFQRPLTKVGSEVLNRVKGCIWKRFQLWAPTT